MRSGWILALLLSVGPTIPLSAQARPWQATDYYRLTVVSNPKLSPDGRRVAFVVTTVVEDKDRRHNEIWMAATDGSAGGAPFRYTSLLWAGIAGYVAFNEIPDAWSLAGAALIVASGLYVLRRDSARARKFSGVAAS